MDPLPNTKVKKNLLTHVLTRDFNTNWTVTTFQPHHMGKAGSLKRLAAQKLVCNVLI